MGINKTALFLIIALVAGCSDVRLGKSVGSSPNASSKGSFCTFDPNQKNAYTNYMFILDFSGSNSSQGTDPGKIRVQKSKEFYDKKKNDPFTRWGGLKFESTPDAVIYETSPEEPIFTDDLSLVERGFEIYDSTSHNGGTNYEATLGMIKGAVEVDIEKNPGRDDYYMLFFITDGEPTVGNRNKDFLVGKVKELVNVKPGRIFLSTAYYGNIGSPDLLQKMAEAGGGSYVKVETEDLDFGDLVPGITTESWVLKNDSFFVYNLNSAICEAKGFKFDLDSDGDGVCDLDERKYGLDPTRRSTPQKNPQGQLVDTGYGDYFHLAQIQGKLTLPPCNPEDRTDEDFDLLNNCEERISINLTPFGTEYKGVIWKELNPKDPDTDNDGIIDGIDVFVFRREVVSSLGWGLDNRVDRDWDGEGVSAFRQVQQHRNPLVDDRTAISYDPQINSIGIENGRSCFSYSQSILPLYPALGVSQVHPMMTRNTNENTVLVYFIQTKFKDPNGKGIYMHSFQNLKTDASFNGAAGTAAGLKVNDRMFTPYETYLKIDSLK